MVAKERVLEALKDVYDPEIGLSIVDLGLVYDLQIKGEDVVVKMTLTTPYCPLGNAIIMDAENKIKRLKGIKNVRIELVWDPPWTPEKMSENAKMKLGVK